MFVFIQTFDECLVFALLIALWSGKKKTKNVRIPRLRSVKSEEQSRRCGTLAALVTWCFLRDTRLRRILRKDWRRDFLMLFTRDRGPSMASWSLGFRVHLHAAPQGKEEQGERVGVSRARGDSNGHKMKGTSTFYYCLLKKQTYILAIEQANH